MYAEVVLPLPLAKSFHYKVPASFRENVDIGSRILVPFGRRAMTGFVIKLRQKNPVPGMELKMITEVLDPYPVFSSRFLTFTQKLADYFYSSWGEVLQASLPPSFVVRSQTRYLVSDNAGVGDNKQKLSPAEARILELLRKEAYTEAYLRRFFKGLDISRLLRRLQKIGLVLQVQELQRDKPRQNMTKALAASQLEMDFSLDKESFQLTKILKAKIKEKAFVPYLLQLPAVMRKPVYLALVRECLSLGRRVLFLTPEISLTQEFMTSFEGKMGGRVALLHSRLSKAQRELQWRRIKGGEVDVVLGPRSALLSPLEDLGLIVVDEEQDDSYYQLESPAYETRWGARLRAQQDKALLVLGAAWPSVETEHRAKKRAHWLGKESRPGKKLTTILDDRTFPAVIGNKIINRIRRRLDEKEPVLVFCSRRGYAAVLACSRCTYTPRCRRCDVAMSYHKKEGHLVCHYCNATEAPAPSCPQCGNKIVNTRGPGIEVISDELRKNFPQHQVESFDRDEAGKRADQEAILTRFHTGKTGILVGTPLLAHRIDLPSVSMIVIFYPEVFLGLSDFQAGQKTFQSMNRMIRFLSAGRNSELIVQTAFPEHHSILNAAFGDYRAFYRQELQYRQVMNYPPFSCMAEVVFQDENLRTAARRSREFSSQVKKSQAAARIEILGPARAPLSKLRGKNRIQVIIKAKNKKELDAVLKEPLRSMPAKRSVTIFE